jgi:hypothetical protein
VLLLDGVLVLAPSTLDGELLLTSSTLNSPITMGHCTFLEPTLIFIESINVGHINVFQGF